MHARRRHNCVIDVVSSTKNVLNSAIAYKLCLGRYGSVSSPAAPPPAPISGLIVPRSPYPPCSLLQMKRAHADDVY